jgi:uncharacterized protein YndB with AHSA1/START domain
MAPIELTVEIDRTPAEVYPYVTDPTRFPEWQTDVVAVHPGEGGFTQVRRFGGAERTLTQRVVLAEPPRRWAVAGVGGPIRPDVTVVIDPLDGGARSRLTFTFTYAGHGMGELLLPLVRRMTAKQAPHSLRRLKQRLEGQSH